MADIKSDADKNKDKEANKDRDEDGNSDIFNDKNKSEFLLNNPYSESRDEEDAGECFYCGEPCSFKCQHCMEVYFCSQVSALKISLCILLV